MGNSYPYIKENNNYASYYYREILSISTIENNEEVTYIQDANKINNLYDDTIDSCRKLTASIQSLNNDRNSTNQYSKNSHAEEYNHNQNLSEAQNNVSELFNEIDNPSEM